MYCKYGNYQHPDNEVNLVRVDKRARYSPRLLKLSTIITIYLQGEIILSSPTQALIDAEIAARINAYSNDGFDFGFYTDAGVLTQHRLTNNDSLTGVNVINTNFPVGDAAEFATKRTFSITLQAEYLTPESQLVSWREQVEMIGNGGPRFVVVDCYEGPRVWEVAQRTSMRIIQSGQAIGYQAYVLPPGSLAPDIEHQDQRRVTFTSAERQGRLAVNYGTEWVYVHTSPTYRELFPVTR